MYIEDAKHIIQTVDIKVYFRRFNEYLSLHETNKAAWERIEEERESIGLPHRYNSFESFKSAKYQYYKRLNKNKVEENPLQIRLF